MTTVAQNIKTLGFPFSDRTHLLFGGYLIITCLFSSKPAFLPNVCAVQQHFYVMLYEEWPVVGPAWKIFTS